MTDSLNLADTVTRDVLNRPPGAPAHHGLPRETRVDPPAAARPDLSPAPGPHLQRRSEPRFAPATDRVWVQWWDGLDYFGRSARLINLSRHGAMLVATMPLEERQAIRLFLEDADPLGGAEATVVGLLVGNKGLHQIHLKFDRPCTDEFLEVGSRGLDSPLFAASSRR